MSKLGRPRRELDTTRITSEFLAGRSESWIAAQLGVSSSSIHRRLVSAGVPLRSAVEASNLRRFRTFPETETVLELLDGLLLGDAFVGDHQASEARLAISQRRDRRSWLDAVQKQLQEAGIETTIKDRGVARGWELRTGKYASLTKQRRRWYPKGKKIVPLDVRLGPQALAQWYWGDGSTGNDGYRMVFNTQGFTRKHVDFLRKRLNQLHGWQPTMHRNRKGFVINVSREEDRAALVDLIRPYCPSCFNYKLEIRR